MARQHLRSAGFFSLANTPWRGVGRALESLEPLRRRCRVVPAQSMVEPGQGGLSGAAPAGWRLQCAPWRLVRSRQGAAVLEMAVVAPVLLLMVVTFADFGRAISQRIDINAALRAGAQHALTASSSQVLVEQTVKDALPPSLKNAATMTVSTVCYCGVLAAGSTALPPISGCADACPAPRAKMMTLRASVDFSPYNFALGPFASTINLNRITDNVTIRSQ